MAYQKVVLTANNDYIACTANYKTDIMDFIIKGNFDSGMLVGIVAYTDKDGNIAFTDEAPFLAGDGTQVELSAPQSFSISSASLDKWYILKLIDSNGSASVEVMYNDLKVKTNNLTVETL